MDTKMITLLSLVLALATAIITIPSVYSEGGGGLDCRGNIFGYQYVNDSAYYEELYLGNATLATLSCYYEIEESQYDGIDSSGEVVAVYYVNGTLDQPIIDEYACGTGLGEEFSYGYITSPSHFAAVAYTIPVLIDVAADLMPQIEGLTPQKCGTITNGTATNATTAVPEVVLPEWIKTNAGWWADGNVTDTEMANSLEFLINENILVLPPVEETVTSEVPATNATSTNATATTVEEIETTVVIPEWIKIIAGMWADGLISDADYLNAIQFLVTTEIITIT